MARLPNPGSDSGQWGNILNDFLEVAHNTDGTLKDTAFIADGSITTVKLDDGAVTNIKIDPSLVDPAAGVAGLRTLGNGANQAMPGNATVTPGSHAATHKGGGSDVIDSATTTVAGLMSGSDKTKLDGVATGATANSSDAQLRDRATHTGTQSADTITDGTTNHVFTAADDTKLTGIATGATANSPDATLLARANHTGTQTASTISDFSAAADARVTAANKKTDSMATNRLLGRGTAGTGAIEEIILGTNLSLTGTTLNAATGTGTTNLTTTAAPTTVTINSDTGTDAAIAAADVTNAGLLLPAEKAKLADIEAAADVTDATNVDAAGAVMNSDTSTAAMQFVIDEDDMASNSATRVPTQQSVKAYSDNSIIAAATIPVTTHTSAYSLTPADAVILGDTTSSSFAVTLPDAATGIRPFHIKKIAAANTLTINTTSSQTIDGGTSIAVTSLDEAITVVSDGSNWRII